MSNFALALHKAANLTEQNLKELADKKDGLVFDLSDPEQFTAARKERAELNKVLKNIDRISIDAKSDIDEARADLKAKVEAVYSPIVTPFIEEDARRKEAKKEAERKEAARISSIRQAIVDIKDMADIDQDACADEISTHLDSATAVDTSIGFLEFKADADLAKATTVAKLEGALLAAVTREKMQDDLDLSNQRAMISNYPNQAMGKSKFGVAGIIKELDAMRVNAALEQDKSNALAMLQFIHDNAKDEEQPLKPDAPFEPAELVASVNDCDAKEAMRYFFDEESIFDLSRKGDDAEYSLEVVLRRVQD